VSRDGGLRQLFRQYLPDVDWQSIETFITGPGIPDSNGCIDGVEFWVEFKLTSAFAVSLQPEQIAWGMRRERHGGRVFVAVRRKCDAGPRKPAADELWLMDICYGLDLSRYGLKHFINNTSVLHWAGGPTKWKWSEVLAMITGRFYFDRMG